MRVWWRMVSSKIKTCTAPKKKFSVKDCFRKYDQTSADLFTFIEEILIRKLHFLCSEVALLPSPTPRFPGLSYLQTSYPNSFLITLSTWFLSVLLKKGKQDQAHLFQWFQRTFVMISKLLSVPPVGFLPKIYRKSRSSIDISKGNFFLLMTKLNEKFRK